MKKKMQPGPAKTFKELSGLRRKVSKRIKRIRIFSWFKLEPEVVALDVGRCRLIKTLTPEHVQRFPAPIFHGRQPNDLLSATVCTKITPIILTHHKNVYVLGSCNFLLHGRVAVHPDLYQPARDRSPLELYGKSRIDKKSFSRILIPLGLTVGSIPRAINLCDQTPQNYAHWMTEILPKLALLNDQPDWVGLPVLVDSSVGANYLESICAAYPSVSEIIRLAPRDRLLVHDLYNISPTAYCPHEFRDFHKAQKAGFQFFFSGWALNCLRTQLRRFYAKYENGRSRKFYLKRTALWTYNNRNIQNIDKIEDLLDERGVELLNITGMTFAEQAKLFMNAEMIVAPTGAALSNMIFAPPGCHIVVLAAAYDGATYDYFHYIACLLGHHLSFVIGPQVEDEDYHMNRDYVIEIDDLKAALDKILSAELPDNSRNFVMHRARPLATS